MTEDHDDQDRLRRDARAVPSHRPARLVRAGRGRRLRGRLHGQRTLPSVDATAGPERVRLVVHGRARTADEPASSGRPSRAPASATTRRSSPTPRRRWGRCSRAASGWASAPARRSTSTSSAVSGRRSASGSAMMFESIEVIDKLFTGQRRQAQGRVLHARERQALHLPRASRCPIYVATAGPGQREEDRQVRRRHHHRRCRGREDRHALGQVRGGRPGGRQGPRRRRPKLLQIHISWARTDEEAVDHARRVAQRRHAVPQAGHQEPRGLRGDGEAGQARATSRTGCS